MASALRCFVCGERVSTEVYDAIEALYRTDVMHPRDFAAFISRSDDGRPAQSVVYSATRGWFGMVPTALIRATRHFRQHPEGQRL